MVAKLVLDQLEKTGGALTALTLPVANATASQYLQNNGSGALSWATVTAASSNILRKIGDYVIVTGDVDGTTELVIACNASAANRTITLPGVAVAGATTCIITVICDADATSTFELKVQDGGSAEVWTGFQKSDFVRLIVSNGAWLVVDHRATMMASKALTGSISLATSAQVKMTSFTDITDIGKVWDNTNNKLVAPFAGIWHLNWRVTSQMGGGFVPAIFVGGARQTIDQWSGDTVGYNYGSHNVSLTVKVAASTDVEFYAKSNQSSAYTNNVQGNGDDYSGFDGTFTRTY